MGMGISLDSMDAEKHNNFRKFPNAWEGAVRGMRNCRKVGLPFQIHTTVMDWNQHELEALTDFAVKRRRCSSPYFSFLVPTGRGKKYRSRKHFALKNMKMLSQEL